MLWAPLSRRKWPDVLLERCTRPLGYVGIPALASGCLHLRVRVHFAYSPNAVPIIDMEAAVRAQPQILNLTTAGVIAGMGELGGQQNAPGR